MRNPPEEERKESSGGESTRTIESVSQRRSPRGYAEPAPAPRSPRGRGLAAAPSHQAARRGSAREQGTLPLSYVKSAGAEALPVQHRLGIGLLLPEPLSRPGWRETFEEAHRGSEAETQTKTEPKHCKSSSPRPAPEAMASTPEEQLFCTGT